MISEKEKKRRQHKKELNSFRNKMGSNIVWFDSLSLTKQYDLLFHWKREKYTNRRVKVVKRFDRRFKVVLYEYPLNFKYFIQEFRKSSNFQPSVTNLRNTTIDLILNYDRMWYIFDRRKPELNSNNL